VRAVSMSCRVAVNMSLKLAVNIISKLIVQVDLSHRALRNPSPNLLSRRIKPGRQAMHPVPKQ